VWSIFQIIWSIFGFFWWSIFDLKTPLAALQLHVEKMSVVQLGAMYGFSTK